MDEPWVWVGWAGERAPHGALSAERPPVPRVGLRLGHVGSVAPCAAHSCPFVVPCQRRTRPAWGHRNPSPLRCPDMPPRRARQSWSQFLIRQCPHPRSRAGTCGACLVPTRSALGCSSEIRPRPFAAGRAIRPTRRDLVALAPCRGARGALVPPAAARRGAKVVRRWRGRTDKQNVFADAVGLPARSSRIETIRVEIV